MADDWSVGQLAPIERNRGTGEWRWTIPQVLRDAWSLVLAPGRALAGEYDQLEYNEETGELSPFDPRMADDAAGLAGLVSVGAAPIPRPAGSLGMGSLRERYRGPLITAAPGKDPNRIKLTPERIDAAKRAMLGDTPFMRQNFPDIPPEQLIANMRARRRFGAGSGAPTAHNADAMEFARAAIQQGERVRVKYPDGPGGSVYVRVGDRGTVRFADHAQPREWDAQAQAHKPVGGFSTAMGRRHHAAEMSVDPKGGASLADAMKWLGGATAVGAGAAASAAHGDEMPMLAQIEAALRKADAAGNVEDARRLAQAYRAMRDGAKAPEAQPAAEEPQQSGNLLDAGLTYLNNTVMGIPIVGPLIQKGSDFVTSEIGGRLTGQDPAEVRQGIEERRAVRNEQYPLTALSGSLAGNLAGYGALGAIPGGANALGITGNFLSRMGNSAASSVAITGTDEIARGNTLEGAAKAAATSGAIGAGIPVAGQAIKGATNWLGGHLEPVVNALRDTGDEALRRVGLAVRRDAASNPQGMMTAADEAVAARSGVPVLNADRGGETTRALARSVANQSPEARAAIENAANDRFGNQAARAADMVKRVAGGSVDDLAFQEGIRDAAAKANRPAYERAFSAPQAQAMFTPELQELMQSPAVQKAARMAVSRNANRAAVEGFVPIKEVPFRVDANGKFQLVTRPDGSVVQPNLQFWDQVKRNLDSEIGKAQRAGDRTLAADMLALKNKLVGSLDEAVPEYAQARRGAAAFFQAEDALEAGKKFAGTPRLIPEAKRAYAAFSPAEKKAFATGFASELIDRIKATGDRTNVINRVFKSDAARESMELALGKPALAEIEAYVRVEDLVDRLRGAMGNSTTARQLMEMGIGAGSGWALTGDWKGATAGALAVKGARMAGQRIDGAVMKEVAQMLTSGDRALIRSAVTRASKEPAYMRALEELGKLIAIPVRGAASASRQSEPQPLQITVYSTPDGQPPAAPR